MAGAGAITWEWAIKTPSTLADVTNNYELCVGLANGASDATQPTEGVYFYYNYATSSGVWVGRTVTSSTVTAVVSSTTVATSTWYTLKATINALNTSVEFFINGTSIGTSTTNLSAAALTPMCSLKWLAGASRSFNADWVKVVQTITTAR